MKNKLNLKTIYFIIALLTKVKDFTAAHCTWSGILRNVKVRDSGLQILNDTKIRQAIANHNLNFKHKHFLLMRIKYNATEDKAKFNG